jgi:cytochrome P450
MPFGFGPRTCIGMGFAMLEGLILLATFVRAMRFAADRPLAPEPISRVTLRPKGGMPLLISRR